MELFFGEGVGPRLKTLAVLEKKKGFGGDHLGRQSRWAWEWRHRMLRAGWMMVGLGMERMTLGEGTKIKCGI